MKKIKFYLNLNQAPSTLIINIKKINAINPRKFADKNFAGHLHNSLNLHFYSVPSEWAKGRSNFTVISYGML